jgi:protein SCO1
MKRALLVLLIAMTAEAQKNSATPPQLPGEVSIKQNLNAQVPLDTMFRDETGKVVRLRDYFHGKPVLLNFVYYRCPMLCGMVLNGVTDTLTELKFDVGTDFEVVTISIDPRDTPADAAVKKEATIKRYGRFASASGWHFLTGPESAIKAVANTVGFHYAYDIKQDQFAHGTMLLVLTPQGHASRYLYGFEYKPQDVRLALVEASNNRIGSVAEQILLMCFHYDPKTGRYTKSTMNAVRASGAATVFAIVGFIVISVRRERRAANGERRTEGGGKE